MKRIILSCLSVVTFLVMSHLSLSKGDNMDYNKLSQEEEYVLLHKGTERPFTGKYLKNDQKGTYICRRCNSPLYLSDDKFDSHCGWPSFDDEIQGAVKRQTDADGVRTEIMCTNCGGHLGHVFTGEHLTDKDTRHCVNSLSLMFIPAVPEKLPRTIYFAAGCFWGVEYYFSKTGGVLSVVSGYIGGTTEAPTYKDVCSGTTGHAEAVQVTYDPEKTDCETLIKLFFEIHDFTQVNRQGPDIGTQYRTEIFYTTEEQKSASEKLIKQLSNKGYKVATKVTKAEKFWNAEDYHQDYFSKQGIEPGCHAYRKLFD